MIRIAEYPEPAYEAHLYALARMARGGELTLACQQVRHLWNRFRVVNFGGLGQDSHFWPYVALRTEIEAQLGEGKVIYAGEICDA